MVIVDRKRGDARFTIVTLVACMVGLASVLAGMHHVRVWRTDSLAAAGAVSLIAWMLTLLAMGIDAKEIHTRYGRSRRLVYSHLGSQLFPLGHSLTM